MLHKTGKTYSNNSTKKFYVTFNKPNAAFLRPNQYVNYSNSSDLLKKTFEITDSFDFISTKIKAIKQYIESNFRYDYIKALTTLNHALPDINKTFEKKTGICQDLAAVCVTMFRAIEIPAKLCIGYVNNIYHAWVEYLYNGEWILYDPTAKLQHKTIELYKYNKKRWY